jgi:hypothetical protein
MRVVAEHKIIFKHVGGAELPEVVDPIYNYKVGDRFRLFYFNPETETADMQEFEVTGIEHELHEVVNGEQKIIVTVIKRDE